MNKLKDSLNVNTVLLSILLALASWNFVYFVKKFDAFGEKLDKVATQQAVHSEKIKTLEATVIRSKNSPPPVATKAKP